MNFIENSRVSYGSCKKILPLQNDELSMQDRMYRSRYGFNDL